MMSINNVFVVAVGFVASLAVFLPDKSFAAGVGLLATVVVAAAGYFLKKLDTISAAGTVLSFITFFVIFSFYIVPSQVISVQAGPILNDNWWNGLNWIRENTAECATIATYWDPGHFIRAIAKRPVIFDGANQNARYQAPYDGVRGGLEMIRYDNGIVQLVNYNQQTKLVERARIKDIGTIMLTANESLAVQYLKDYKKEGCSEIYFLATSDLIPKSVWWSCFATWDPTKPEVPGQQCSKGNPLQYTFINRARSRPIPALGIVGFEYPVGDGTIILCQANETVTACRPDTIGFFQQGNQFVKLKRIILPQATGVATLEDPSAQFPGTVLVGDPSGQTIVFLPDQLEGAMFTRMFMLNGLGLQKFKLVQNFGNEFKLFKVDVD